MFKSTSVFGLMNLFQSVKKQILLLFNLQGASLEECDRSGGIAQLGERLPCKQEVAGSTPAVSTIRNNS